MCSRVEEKARKYWWDRNRRYLKLIDERMEPLRNDLEYKDMKEGDLRDKVIEDLNREIYPEMIEWQLLNPGAVDADLGELCGVETKLLNKAVKDGLVSL